MQSTSECPTTTDDGLPAPGAEVTLQTRHGQVQGTVLKLSRQHVVFELYDPEIVLRASEVLENVRIRVRGRLAYGGRAVIRSTVDTGQCTVGEATLHDAWPDVDPAALHADSPGLDEGIRGFLQRWHKAWAILPEYKLAVADLQSFLIHLRLWLDPVELGLQSHPAPSRARLERETAQTLSRHTTPVLAGLFDRFEAAAGKVEGDRRPVHRQYCRRLLHPLLMASPFMRRIYAKPLGYAGDYEMVNMMLRNPCEGASTYARLLNLFILAQTPAEAHRNRVQLLTRRLVEETCRVRRHADRIRVFNIGCGPAGEVQQFLAQHAVSSGLDLTLLDMNDETLDHASQTLETLNRRHSRMATFRFIKRNIQQFLKQAGKVVDGTELFDFIYCAGLFDYLNDRVCQTLLAAGYHMLHPGGLLLVTNVDPTNPLRHLMEDLFEWHLMHRNARQMARLAAGVRAEAASRVYAETTSCNVFLEIRKPPAA
ncbi:MAG: class I SAM-dependent methyltransferase [Verrucomicrobia bacterium]|nr:class I SAM-dependent methyltransferase [Verrucomicrobiota bacterium]